MSNIKIIADSTCDLSQDLVNRYSLNLIPLMISMGENSLKDGVEVDPFTIFEWSNRTGETPKTASPTLGDAVEFLKPYFKEDDEVIFFGISETMSSTCNVMRLAAENLGYHKLHVIDSKNISNGIALQIIRAADLVQTGYSVEDIILDNQQINGKVKASFVVDTLTFLYRGGRCSAVSALLANTLKLKPKIVVIDGKMEVATKYRGNQKSVIHKYIKDLEAELLLADSDRVFLVHSGCPEEILNNVKEYLTGLHIFNEVLILQAGGVISSHCGPNTLGVMFLSK